MVLVPLLYGGFLATQEWRFRQALALDVPTVATPDPVQVHERLNVQAVTTVLGLAPLENRVPSTAPFTLHASFASTHGASRALLADAAGTRLYQVGERLPGGSVLRRVEAGSVVLWRNGREERLELKSASQPFLRRQGPEGTRQAMPHSSQYLRPVDGQAG